MAKSSSDTTDEALRVYRIGEKARALRLRKKMGLVELGEHTGLSPGLLSKIENGKMFPPLPTLVRIAMVFGVGLDHFFTEEQKTLEIVRAADRKRFAQPVDSGRPSFHFESLDFPANDRKMSSYLAEFEDVDLDEAEAHSHEGAEMIYVQSGRLRLRIGDEVVDLAKDDSIYFDSSVPHAYAKAGKAKCSAIVVTVE